MSLTSSPIWGVVQGAESFEAFQANILRPIYVKPGVPEDVKESVKIVHKLLLHSYYEYPFIDVALTQAIFAFEKALKITWKNINGTESKKNLQKLILWFYDNNYFESWNREIPQQLRYIRNVIVHDENKTLAGVAFLNLVYSTIDLINDLYEDQSLRTLRQTALTQLGEQFENLLKQGGILSFNEHRYIVFKAFPVFLDNKALPEILSVSICPIFDLTPFKEGECFTPDHFQFSLIDHVFDDAGFSAIDSHTGNKIAITKITDEINSRKFINWHSDLFRLPNWPLVTYIATEPLKDFYSLALRKFHATE